MISNTKALFVIDLLLPNFDNGKLFDSNIALRPGLSIWPYFRNHIRNYSYDIITINDFIKHEYYKYNIPFYGISYEGYSSTMKIFKKYNIKPFLIYSGEPAKNAPFYYLNFNRKIKYFENVMAFSGYKKFIRNKNINFINLLWPNTFPDYNNYTKTNYLFQDFQKLKLICFVASPKSRIPVNYKKLISRLFRMPRYFLYEFIFIFFPITKGKDLYKIRLNLVKDFLKYKEFFLFGNDWDFFIKYNQKFKNVEIANKISTCKDKITTIKDFMFCICIENTDFEGYITEKIFDAFYANTIPVFLGNDKINDYIPKNCFINIKDFKNNDELYIYLKNLSFDEWKQYILNINLFLDSCNFKKFSKEIFSDTILNALNKKNTHCG